MMLYLVFAVVVASVTAHPELGRPMLAIASIVGNGIKGKVVFIQPPQGKMRIQGTITGLPPGNYGFHIYEKGDITEECKYVGSHFNPDNNDHGHPDDENRHAGDLGNIVFDENRVSKIDIIDRLISFSGPRSVLGRAVGVHERADDFGKTDHPDSKTTGNTGKPLACGVIGISFQYNSTDMFWQ